ncbi:hypothetical protein GCM10018772_46610 [Streptomyces fumanus]|uniref:Uncharacterized protein n=1 Tax=Streptomyces fumanus TaxID=67302 RepID=A0A919ANQ7_9ACTN|nr:hypothetical protein GCM10018772_46610 [Streptomyces fumanus]
MTRAPEPGDSGARKHPAKRRDTTRPDPTWPAHTTAAVRGRYASGTPYRSAPRRPYRRAYPTDE